MADDLTPAQRDALTRILTELDEVARYEARCAARRAALYDEARRAGLDAGSVKAAARERARLPADRRAVDDIVRRYLGAAPGGAPPVRRTRIDPF